MLELDNPDGVTDLDEQVERLADIELPLVAKLRDADASHQFEAGS